jgi:hypothetical protein
MWLRVIAGGESLISSAGGSLLTRTARVTGLERALAAALKPWLLTNSVHHPAKIVTDLAVTIALGGDCAADIAVLRSQPGVFGTVASDPTVSRTVDRLATAGAEVLTAIRAARASARERVWQRTGSPTQHGWLVLDPDATLITAHSEKQDAAKTWKKTFGTTRCWCLSITARAAPGNPSRVCCAAGTPARTPPQTMSPSWTTPSLNCPPACGNLTRRGG